MTNLGYSLYLVLNPGSACIFKRAISKDAFLIDRGFTLDGITTTNRTFAILAIDPADSTATSRNRSTPHHDTNGHDRN